MGTRRSQAEGIFAQTKSKMKTEKENKKRKEKEFPSSTLNMITNNHWTLFVELLISSLNVINYRIACHQTGMRQHWRAGIEASVLKGVVPATSNARNLCRWKCLLFVCLSIWLRRERRQANRPNNNTDGQACNIISKCFRSSSQHVGGFAANVMFSRSAALSGICEEACLSVCLPHRLRQLRNKDFGPHTLNFIF